MILLAFLALTVAVGLGGCMASGRLRRARLVHGVAGLAGLTALAAALAGGALRGPFAWDALGLAGAAFAGGVTIFVLTRRRIARPGLLILLHGFAGGLAYLLLAGFMFG